MGVVEENPSTIAGVSNILRHLHQYVPVTPGGIPHSIPCHGDGLSVERMCDSLRHNSGGLTPMERLEGIVPVPQEFHKRALLLQVGIYSETHSCPFKSHKLMYGLFGRMRHRKWTQYGHYRQKYIYSPCPLLWVNSQVSIIFR